MATANPAQRAVLFGREREIAILDDVLSRGRQRGHATVIRGDPGIGKSALLAVGTVDARALGYQVLTATGIQSEAELPFAGLHQLTRALPWDIDSLPGPRRDALRAAFGQTSSLGSPDGFLIALATLESVSELASHAPLLIVAEDAQWLDGPTAEVLKFVAACWESPVSSSLTDCNHW